MDESGGHYADWHNPHVLKWNRELLSHVSLPPHGARQSPLSMQENWQVSRQENWSGLPFHSLGYLPDPGIELGPSALQAEPSPSKPAEDPHKSGTKRQNRVVLLYVRYLEWSNPWRKEVGSWGERDENCWSMDIEFQFCKVKNFWRLVAQPCDHVNILNITELNRLGRKVKPGSLIWEGEVLETSEAQVHSRGWGLTSDFCPHFPQTEAPSFWCAWMWPVLFFSSHRRREGSCLVGCPAIGREEWPGREEWESGQPSCCRLPVALPPRRTPP